MNYFLDEFLLFRWPGLYIKYINIFLTISVCFESLIALKVTAIRNSYILFTLKTPHSCTGNIVQIISGDCENYC